MNSWQNNQRRIDDPSAVAAIAADETASVKSRIVWTPHPGQQRAIDAFATGKNVLVQAGRQWGKTSVVLHILMDHPCARRQARRALRTTLRRHREVTDALKDEGIEHTYNSRTKRLYFADAPGSSVTVYTSQRPDNIRGGGYHIVVMDEFAYWEYPEDMFVALEPTLYVRGAKWLIATTPPIRPQDVQAHKMLSDLRRRPDVAVVHGKTSDNPAIPEADLQAREEEWSSAVVGGA